MKKLLLYTVFIFTAATASAQKDEQAKMILNQVSQKYKSFAVIKSDFTFTIDAPQAGTKQVQNGTLITQTKTDKYKVTLYAPGAKTDVEQEITSDGKSQWTYLKKDKEVQLADAGHGGDSFSPAQLFTMYEHGYKYLFTGEHKTGGKIYQLIDLTPEDDKKQFFKIRLTIDKLKKQITNALIFDRNGSKYTYTLNSFNTSTKVPDDTFTFNTKAHPGVEVVNLK